VLIDGTVHLTFRRPHCPHCLVQRHGSVTLYSHQVLEAKLAGPAGVVASLGTEFIANADLADTPAEAGAERRKQDCELKAWQRLAARLKRDFPQLPVCVGGDALYACAPVMAACEDNGWAYVLTLKPGRLPTVWAEFQALLPQCPENRVECRTPQGAEQVYRWVSRLSHTGEGGRIHTFSAIECKETVNGVTTTWAWVTRLPVTRSTVVEVAVRGGRGRWCIENEGFNAQKNSELNLEHAYSEGQEQLRAFYYLLQIAHLMMQLVEKGSLLRRLAAESGRTVLGLFGSLKNVAKRLLDSLRFTSWPEECCGAAGGRGLQIRLGLDSS
jgi:hypothetical protein